MDLIDPSNIYHKYSKQKQCDTLRVNFAGDHNYQHITYQYYDDMEREKKFDLDNYVDRLTKYYQHYEQAFNRNLSRGQHVHAHSETREPEVSSTRNQADISRDGDFVSFSKAFALYQQNQNRQSP